jgi:hypothetical protein
MRRSFLRKPRGLNQPDIAIDAACEKILLGALRGGRTTLSWPRPARICPWSATGLPLTSLAVANFARSGHLAG